MEERSVMLSVHPVWCGKIAELIKTLEVRKSIPRLPMPFKVYIYCTRLSIFEFWKSAGGSYVDTKSRSVLDICGNGRVIGEFVCDRAYRYTTRPDYSMDDIPTDQLMKESCLTWRELYEYECGSVRRSDPDKRKGLYAWHISQLQIYDQPKFLEDFGLTHAPQSWCFVKEAA